MSFIASVSPIDLLDGCTPTTRRILHVVHEIAEDTRERIDVKRILMLFGTRELGMDPDDVEAACEEAGAKLEAVYPPDTVGYVYRELLRLGQPWRTRYPLLDVAGMVGDHHDDDPGGPDLVSARVSRLSDVVLPLDRAPLLPIGLLNGRVVSDAPVVPPHNVSELWTAMEHIRQEPNESLDDLMEVMPGPDFPSGGAIVGIERIRDLYETGSATLVVRATAEDELQGYRTRIAVTALPPGVLVRTVIEQIRALTRQGRLPLTQLEDRSTPERVRIVLDAPGSVTTDTLKATLFERTDCERRLPCELTFASDGQAETRPLRDWLMEANRRCTPAWRPKRGPILDRVPTLREIMDRGGYESPLFTVVDQRRTRILADR